MNKKGQTLVAFVLILPLLVLILSFIINLSFIYIAQRNLDNNIKNAIGVRFSDRFIEDEMENKIRDLILKNNDNINELEIYITNENIKIRVGMIYDTKIPTIIGENKFTIKSNYEGYKLNDELIIVKE